MISTAGVDFKVSGVVWCGVVWCGVVWCGAVWRGVVRAGRQTDYARSVFVAGRSTVVLVRQGLFRLNVLGLMSRSH